MTAPQPVAPKPVRQPDRQPATRTVADRTCNICGFQGRFGSFGDNPHRIDARCGKCGSLERHRLLKLFLDESGFDLSDRSVLHFAPEGHVRRFVKPAAGSYVTTDYLSKASTDLRLNIEQIELEDDVFDVVICSHVLEHVDDVRALKELFRILTPGGLAILAVPLIEGWDRTYEDKSITAPGERRLHFGQHDHLRLYGRDFRERVTDAGFRLDEFVADGRQCVQFGLWRGERLFLAKKPVPEAKNQS